MSSDKPAPPRHAQGDQLIVAIAALTAATVAQTFAIKANTKALRELAEEDEDDPACEDCGEEDCDGDCVDDEDEDEDEQSRRRRR